MHEQGRMAAMARTWTVGVDAGGTWVRARATNDRGQRRRARVRATASDELEITLGRIWRRWHMRRGHVARLVVASRGVWTPAERRRAARRLRGLAREVLVISDAEAAYLGALGPGPGVLVLSGTGSIVLGRDARGRWIRRGGLGPLFHDAGSAFSLGLTWLGHGDEARARRFAKAPDAVARIAALGPRVIRLARGGNVTARLVVGAEAAALAWTLARVAGALRLDEETAASWAGSLMGDDYFRAQVWRWARRQGLRITPRAPRESALDAAARLAAARGR
jgi:N-acetylglucosamine kinase-like BadF-type ATPase